jgi:alkylation response protein AidB-like acyl-CoA dehydrogenase
MRFSLSEEQVSFRKALQGLLAAADVPGAARSWSHGDHEAGLKIWSRLAELGLPALLVPEPLGGIGGSPLDMVVGFEELGRYAVPGPWIETAALAPALLAGTELEPVLEQVAAGEARLSFAAPPATPRALDADTASATYVLQGDSLLAATVGTLRTSVDPTRRLFELEAGNPVAQPGAAAATTACDLAALACAATLVGAGDRLLAESVEYVGSRRQFGRAIGEYQAIKHALANVRVALDFAHPLVHGAALELGASSTTASRDVSAAKVAASDAAHLAMRTALQVHGAIGYTLEFDLSLWLLKVRALVGAWGTPAVHRTRVLDSLTRS